MRPRIFQFPLAGGQNRLVLDIRILVFQQLQDLLVEAGNIPHAKRRGEHPLFVVAGMSGADRGRMPVLRSPHRTLQNPTPHLLRSIRVGVCFPQ